MNLQQLRDKFKNEDFIPYSEFLQTDEWKQKRQTILQRDSHQCTSCNKQETISHYDSKLRKTVYFWFGEEATGTSGVNKSELLPVPIFSDKPYYLAIHHELYIHNRLPWDYSDSDLTTLCNWCHWEFHQNNIVKVYSEDKLNELRYTPCHRCNGAGWLPQYKNVENGICFRCRGGRYEEMLIKK